MLDTRFWLKKAVVLVAILVLPNVFSSRVGAQTETVLHSLKTKEGASPLLGVIFDSSGNLYGVAGEEGGSGSGSVFELSPSGSSWTEKTLHSFNGGSDGSTPVGTLVFDKSGNLYGTTKLGGSHGVGVVYELTKSGSTWSEKVLHNFGGGKDGEYPTGNLVFDSTGNLYGTTEGGGSHGNGEENVGGTAFKVTPKSGTASTETVIHSFGGSGDGISPRASLIFDSAGNLYGTTFSGGTQASGTVFELSPKSGGSWTESILHNFNPVLNFGSTDGASPAAGLVFDSAGNLYGTTVAGGDGGGGVAFKLSPSGTTWSETVLFPFFHTFYSPSYPYSGLIFDKAGDLYGATLQGNQAAFSFQGTVFELTPTSSGYWNSITLYSFDGTHGSAPAIGSLVFDTSGNLYGATQAGGANKNGTVFEITP
jgi:uncharacterized repeat protein (TIGR03803 family)